MLAGGEHGLEHQVAVCRQGRERALIDGGEGLSMGCQVCGIRTEAAGQEKCKLIAISVEGSEPIYSGS